MKLKIFGISFLIVSAISFLWAIIVYINYYMWLEEIMKKCANVPPCMMPVNTSMDYVNLGILIGTILGIIGIILLAINRKKNR
jgi:hypothetical protein